MGMLVFFSVHQDFRALDIKSLIKPKNKISKYGKHNSTYVYEDFKNAKITKKSLQTEKITDIIFFLIFKKS